MAKFSQLELLRQMASRLEQKRGKDAPFLKDLRLQIANAEYNEARRKEGKSAENPTSTFYAGMRKPPMAVEPPRKK